MDKGKGGGHGESSDPDDHSHPNKPDDTFLVEEDEDYDELYGNIDIYPGFLQPLSINEASGVKNIRVERKKPQLPPPQQRPFLPGQNAGGVSLPGTSGIRQKQPFVGGGSRLFYLGELHWWTTDADVEYELYRYGKVREVKFFSQKVNGKSKGYCKVEFYDPLAAAACKKGLVGHEFNGRPCVVSSSHAPFLDMNQPGVDNEVKKDPDEVEATKPGDGNDGKGDIKEGGDGDNQGKKGPDEVKVTKPGDGINQGGDRDNQGKKGPDEVEAIKPDDSNGNGGRGSIKEGGDGNIQGKKGPDEVKATNLGDRINQGGDGDNQGKKGPDEVGAIKPGDGNGGRGGIKDGGEVDKRGYGRGNWGRGNNLGMGNRGHGNPVKNRGGGMGGRSIMTGGGAPQMLMHPRMSAMSRIGGYAGFHGGTIPQSPRSLPSYRSVGLRGVAPYGNYSFNGRRMPMRGKGMIPRSGMGGPNMGRRLVPDMGRLDGDEHGGAKVAETSNVEEAASDRQYDEANHGRGDLPNVMREKDRGSERDFPGTSERPFDDDRVPDLPNAMREKDRGSERDLPGTSERPFEDDRVPEFDRYVPEHVHEEIGNLDDREISRARSRDSDIGRERSRSRDHVPDREKGWNRDRHRENRDRFADHHRFTDHAPQHNVEGNVEGERGRSSRPSIKSRLSYPTRKYSHNGKRR